MNIANIITLITVVGGIPTIAVVLIYIGRKLQVLDTLSGKVERIENNVERIESNVGSIDRRLLVVEERIKALLKDRIAPSHSPRQLNDRGTTILNQSGIKQIIDERKQTLLDAIKNLKPTNAYDAEQASLDVVSDLPKHCPEVIPQLKDGAFKTGQGIETVLLVGGFYLRDLIFPELGFSSTDLDQSKTS